MSNQSIYNVQVEAYPKEEPGGIRITLSPELLRVLAEHPHSQIKIGNDPGIGNISIAVEPVEAISLRPAWPHETQSAHGDEKIEGRVRVHAGSVTLGASLDRADKDFRDQRHSLPRKNKG